MTDTPPLPPLTPEEIVEELREQAQEKVDDLNADRPAGADFIGLPQFRVEDTLEGMAADCIEQLLANANKSNADRP